MKRFVKRNIKYILTTLLLLVFFCCAVRGIHIRSVKDVRNEAQELAGIGATVSPGKQGEGQTGTVPIGSDGSFEGNLSSDSSDPLNHAEESSADGNQTAVGKQDSSWNDQKASGQQQSSNEQNENAAEDSAGRNEKTAGKSNSTGQGGTTSGNLGSAGKNRKTSEKSNSVGKNGKKTEQPNSSAKRKVSDGTATKPDQYHTDPVPSGRPEPVNAEDQSVNQKKSFYVYLSIDVLTVLDHMEDLKMGLEKYIPEDGWILPKTQVLCYEGETAWDVMSRECKAREINVQSTYTPMYNSVYMEGINQIGEFDCGKNSGWIYEVDGWIPNYSFSRYVMVEGEYLRWRYSCVGFGSDLDGVKR